MKTSGGPDYEIELVVKDSNELNEIISKIRKQFFKVIEYSRTHKLAKTIKQIYLPEKI